MSQNLRQLQENQNSGAILSSLLSATDGNDIPSSQRIMRPSGASQQDADENPLFDISPNSSFRILHFFFQSRLRQLYDNIRAYWVSKREKYDASGNSGEATNVEPASSSRENAGAPEASPENFTYSTSNSIDSKLSTYVEWYEANKLLHKIHQDGDLNRLLLRIEERERRLLNEIYSYASEEETKTQTKEHTHDNS